MLLRRLFAAAALAAATLAAHATPQPRDATDMWYNPAESGWGFNVIHQGNTLFGTLFVYGQDGQPRWYVASSMVAGPDTYSGALYEATGGAVYSAASFDPKTVTMRQVGLVSLTVGDSGGTLDYTVDGVHVTKQVVRFSFLATSVAGSYVGSIYQPNSAPNPLVNMTVNDDGANVTMSTGDSTGTCNWTGTHGQNGQYTTVSGTYTCGDSRPGTWSMVADPDTDGITASMVIDGVAERLGAARTGASAMRGNGYRNEMWFVPSESGWGFNTIEQGDMTANTLFGTLFVYDAQGRPKWYVVSNLERHDLAGDVMYHLGTLYETTGPYFGGAFNPAAVTRRPVGTLSLMTSNVDGSGHLFYTVDGASVDKNITRFAFRKNDFSGNYVGELVAAASGGGFTSDALNISIDDSSGFVMRTDGAGDSCTYTAPAEQAGHLRVMSGTYTCSSGRGGSFRMANATVTANGFSAQFTASGVSAAHIAGVRAGG